MRVQVVDPGLWPIAKAGGSGPRSISQEEHPEGKPVPWGPSLLQKPREEPFCIPPIDGSPAAVIESAVRVEM